MPFAIQSTEEGLILELSGELTIRHAHDLATRLASSFVSGAEVAVRARELEDVDTSILQILVSLRKTASTFAMEDCSAQFTGAVDRCGLRRELLAGSGELP